MSKSTVKGLAIALGGARKATKARKATPVAPVKVPVVSASGRTISAIAADLSLTPKNARRLARKHAVALGHANKGDRWLMSPAIEKAFRDIVLSRKAV